MKNTFFFSLLAGISICFLVPLATADTPNDNGGGRADDSFRTQKMAVRDFSLELAADNRQGGIDLREIKKLVEQFHNKNGRRYDVDAFRSLTDTITEYYRSSGYFLASAYIPEQTIKDGVVVIRILEGVLTQVEPEKNKLYSDKRLAKPLSYFIGEPVNQAQIETAMLHLNDYPGLKASAIFAPGETIGTTLLTINTTQETPYNASLGLDNYGNKFTGQYRFRSNVTLNNQMGLADRLSFDVVQTLDPTNSTYWALGFELPVWLNGLSAGFSYSNNAYAVGDIFSDIGIDGSSKLIDIHGRYNILRSREKNLFSRFGVTSKSSSSDGGGDNFQQMDELNVLYGTIGFNDANAWPLGRNSAELVLSQGLTEQSEEDESAIPTTPTDDKFTKANISYTHSIPFENNNNQYLIASARVQYTPDVLSSLEQMALGGPQNARAYEVSQYLVDSGAIFNVEWYARTLPSDDLKWTKNIQLSVYFDYAWGNLNDSDGMSRNITSEGSSVTLMGIGGGIRLTPSKGYQLHFDLAFPLEKPDPNEDFGLQVLFNFGYHF